MLERRALLARQLQPAPLRARQCGGAVLLVHAMLLALGHQFRCALQPLLRLDHLARREAIFATPILAKLDQIGRRANGAHRPVELILPVRVAMHEHGKVAVGERSLLVGDRVERDARLRDDAFAVALGDLAVILDPLGLRPALAHALRGGADLILRLKVDALRFQRSVIYADVYVEFGQPRVDVIRPALAPSLDKLGAVPVAFLRAETLLVHLAHGEHDMGVRLDLPVRADIPMHIEVRDHAAIDKLGLDEIAGKFDALLLVHFARNGKLHLAGKLRVLALLGRLDLVPEFFPIRKAFGGAIGQEDFRMDDTRFVGEVMVAVEPVVVQPGGGTIGRRCNGAAPLPATNDMNREVIDCHSGNPSTPLSARRHDV